MTRLPKLLWGAILALAVLLLLEWTWPAATVPAGAPPRIAAHATTETLAERDTAEWADTILARPLFSISRRPPKAAAASGVAAAPTEARLAGILISRYGRRAIFAPEGGGKPLVLAEGAAINDSTIRQIQPNHVVLASGTVLTPAYDRNRSTATTVAPFQPTPPGFPAQGFVAPGFAPNPTFPPNGMPNPAFQPPAMPGMTQPTGEPQPGLPFRNPMLPPRRE